MACNEAPTCRRALEEASRLWPGRPTASDGICPSAQHTANNPDSDHERGEAFDITHDPTGATFDAAVAFEAIRRRRDPRVSYVIHNRQTAGPGTRGGGWEARPYTGSNPHTSHLHVSILTSARNSDSAWWAVGENISLGDIPAVALGIASNPLGAITAALGILTDTRTWARVGLAIAGFALTVAGVLALARDLTLPAKVRGAIT